MVKSIIAKVEAQNDKIEALKNELTSLIDQTHKEPGNISYDIFQETNAPTKFQVLEVYKDEDAFKAHLNASYMQAFQKKLDDLVVGGTFDIIELTPCNKQNYASPEVRGIEHIGVTVPNIEEAATFFEHAFGAKAIYDLLPSGAEPLTGATVEDQLGIPKGAKITRMRQMRLANSANIELFELSNTEQNKPAQLQDYGLTHIGIYTDDIQKTAKAFVDAGGQLLSEIHPLAGIEEGQNNAGVYGRAPWGTLIELISMPAGIKYPHEQTISRWKPTTSA